MRLLWGVLEYYLLVLFCDRAAISLSRARFMWFCPRPPRASTLSWSSGTGQAAGWRAWPDSTSVAPVWPVCLKAWRQMSPDRGTPLDAQVQGIGLCLCCCLSKISVSVDTMYFIQWQLMLYHSEEALMLLPNGRMCGIFFYHLVSKCY